MGEDIVFGLRRGECFKGTKTERVSRVMEKLSVSWVIHSHFGCSIH